MFPKKNTRRVGTIAGTITLILLGACGSESPNPNEVKKVTFNIHGLSCVQPSMKGAEWVQQNFKESSFIRQEHEVLKMWEIKQEEPREKILFFVGDIGLLPPSKRTQHVISIRSQIENVAASHPNSHSLVILLGGLGDDKNAIETTVRLLMGTNEWSIFALPGLQENLREHRSAMQALSKKYPIVDASVAPLLMVDTVLLVGLGGAPAAALLQSGNDGCIYSEDQLSSLLTLGKKSNAIFTILVASFPPRQWGTKATDRSLDGIHLGSLPLKTAVSKFPVHAIIHPQIPETVEGSTTNQSKESLTTPNNTVISVNSTSSVPLFYLKLQPDNKGDVTLYPTHAEAPPGRIPQPLREKRHSQ